MIIILFYYYLVYYNVKLDSLFVDKLGVNTRNVRVSLYKGVDRKIDRYISKLTLNLKTL